LGSQEEANRPDPLGSLMIVPTMSVIIIVVISLVVLVLWIECLDTHAVRLHQDFSSILEMSLSMLLVEQFSSISHSNTYIASQLIISVNIRRTKDIFVNSSSVDIFGFNNMLVILATGSWHKEASFEVVMDLFGPISKFHLTLVGLDAFFLDDSLLMHLLAPN
jgi:hypothetical protein